MSGSILADTNILVYLLKGNKDIAEALSKKDIFISFITELELLSYRFITKEEESLIKELFQQFGIVEINNQIKEEVIRLRKKYSLKLPDAIILATSNYLNIPVFTADKDLAKITKDVKIVLLN